MYELFGKQKFEIYTWICGPGINIIMINLL
jgi:hypothetical protein